VAICSSQRKSPSIALPDMQIENALPSLRKASRMATYYADVDPSPIKDIAGIRVL